MFSDPASSAVGNWRKGVDFKISLSTPGAILHPQPPPPTCPPAKPRTNTLVCGVVLPIPIFCVESIVRAELLFILSCIVLSLNGNNPVVVALEFTYPYPFCTQVLPPIWYVTP